MSPQLPVWFIVLFVFLMIGLIVCIIILFLQVNKKNVSPPGPAGPQGLRGEVGFTGLRGEQGYQGPIGFQGVQGNNATFSTVSGVVVLTARAPLPAPLAVLIQNQVRVQFFYIRRIAGINFYSLDTTMVGSGIIIAPNPVLATNTFSFIIDTVDPIPADVENIINFMGTATCTNTNDGENAILTSVQRDTPRQFRLIYTTGTGSIRNIQPTSNYFCNFQLNFFGQAFFP